MRPHILVIQLGFESQLTTIHTLIFKFTCLEIKLKVNISCYFIRIHLKRRRYNQRFNETIDKSRWQAWY